MIPFRLTLQPGLSIVEQVVYAAKKAVVAGQLRPGEVFPSVRILSRELKINPNTAHKAVTQLIHDGLLEVLPGQGTVVSRRGQSSPAERAALLEDEIEHLVVEAKKLDLPLDEVRAALERHWRKLSEKTRRQS